MRLEAYDVVELRLWRARLARECAVDAVPPRRHFFFVVQPPGQSAAVAARLLRALNRGARTVCSANERAVSVPLGHGQSLACLVRPSSSSPAVGICCFPKGGYASTVLK